MSIKDSLQNLTRLGSVSQSIILLGLIRGGNIVVQLLLIPLTLKFINAEFFGFWLTLSTAVTWLNLLDLGLSNGLRNKLSIAIIQGDYILARKLVSTTYFFLVFIAILGTYVCFNLLSQVKMYNFLTIPNNISQSELSEVLFIIISSFFLNFLFKPLNAVSYSLHKPYIEPLISLGGGIINALAILILVNTVGQGDILIIAILFCFTPIFVNVVLSIILYLTTFNKFRPTAKLINFKLIAPLFSLSIRFFIIQIAATIVLTTTNFIISKYYGNEAVTEYNIVQRFFSGIIILQSMVLTPYWSLITDAYEKRDSVWLRGVMSKLLKINHFSVMVVIFMIIFAPSIFRFWIGPDFHVSWKLIILFGVYTIFFLYNAVFVTFINGTGKVKLQMITSIFTCVLYIPVVLFFIRVYDLGIIGVIAGATCWIFILFPFRIVQYFKLIKFSERDNIWNS